MSEHDSPPAQQQERPDTTAPMQPRPSDLMRDYQGSGKLSGRRALITGGDSGIGRAVAIAFAKEGADVFFSYLSEHDDAKVTSDEITRLGKEVGAIAGDLADAAHCETVVRAAVAKLGGLDIVVNNVATQQPVDDPNDITDEQWLRTFDVNIHSFFRVTRHALAHLGAGSTIINTASVNGLRGNKSLIDYSATKGAVIAWTYSMAQALVDKGIRANAVAPGPVWTPLIPATMPEQKVEGFGEQAPFGRPAHPDELAPSYVFLASEQMSSYYSGEVLSVLGGEIADG